MNDSSQPVTKPEDANFGKSNSFEHMMAMQEQIFNPPTAAGGEETKVTDFSSFGGGNTTSVNDLSTHTGINMPTDAAKPEDKVEEKPEEKVEEVIDSRSEEEMHSLFSDPNAGTAQDVSAEEKMKLKQERQASEQALKVEEQKADAEYKAAETGVGVAPVDLTQSSEKPGEATESTETPKAATIAQPTDLPELDQKPTEEKTEAPAAEEKAEEPKEAPTEVLHEEPKDEGLTEVSHEEPKEEAAEEKTEGPKEEVEEKTEEPKEEITEVSHDEPKEEVEEPKEEAAEEKAEEPKEEVEEPKEAPTESTPEVLSDNPVDLRAAVRERLSALRIERNNTIVDIDKLEDELLESDSDTEQIKDQLKAKHEDLRHKEHAIAGLIELLHTL